MSFKDLGLKEEILKGIEELGFEEPTEIQKQAIPLLLGDQSDLVALAQTGTGKTAGFGLPLLNLIEPFEFYPQAVILSPTRELCNQIADDLKNFSKHLKGIRVLSVYGGANISTQIKDLKKGVNIIVATPGRLGDLIRRGKADLSMVDRVVLDEADEMLNMGFKDELDGILGATPEDKNTWLFSATMAPDVERIAKNYMHSPKKITVGSQNQGAKNIEHKYYLVRSSDRFFALKRIVDSNPDIFGLIFCRTKRDTQEIADRLMAEGYNVDALHGDMSQIQRDRVMDKFRDRQIQLLCATDVAARGIDVSDITHVINYELPEDIESYTHRSGRTARAGKKGESLCIITDRDRYKIARIEKIIKTKFIKSQVPNGDEVCKAQLFNLVHQVKSTEVLDEEFGQYQEEVLKEFEDLSKDDVVRLFISKEFNRFIEYYKDSADINLKDGGRRSFGRDRDDRDRGRRSDRGDRNGRDRGDRGNSRGGSQKTIFINLGTSDDFNKGKFIDFICTQCEIPGRDIGKIRMNDKFSFFEVTANQGDKVLSSLKSQSYNSRKIRAEYAKPR